MDKYYGECSRLSLECVIWSMFGDKIIEGNYSFNLFVFAIVLKYFAFKLHGYLKVFAKHELLLMTSCNNIVYDSSNNIFAWFRGK